MLNIGKKLQLLTRPSFVLLQKHAESTVAAQTKTVCPSQEEASPEWELYAGLCITRPPVIGRELCEIEKKYLKMIMRKEVEASLKSDHELQALEDIERKKILESPEALISDIEQAPLKTAAEFEDESSAELAAFQFEPTITEDDKKMDVTSMYRELQRSLVMVTPSKVGLTKELCLPQSQWIPGETLRDTCDRLLKSLELEKLDVRILGNAPCGFYKYKYSKKFRRNGYIGGKIFFYTSEVCNLRAIRNMKRDNVFWFTHDEMNGQLDTSYHKAIKKFLVSDA